MYTFWLVTIAGCTFEPPPDVVEPSDESIGSAPSSDADADADADADDVNPIEIPWPSEPLAIDGLWHHTRTSTIEFDTNQSTVTDAEPRTIATFNNEQQWLIYSDGAVLGDIGTRLDWHIDETGRLAWCEGPTAMTVGALMAAEKPDSTIDGCFGERWLKARADVPIRGVYSWYDDLYTFDSFEMVHNYSGTEAIIAGYWMGESWLIFQTADEDTVGAAWVFGWYPDGDGYRVCQYAVGESETWVEASAHLDPSDSTSGCEGFAWDSIRKPFVARGNYEPLDSLMPNVLYEWFSYAETDRPSELVNWQGYGTHNDGTTMVLGTMSPLVDPNERFIKLQVDADEFGQWHVCLLAAASNPETAQAAPPTSLAAAEGCTAEALDGTAGWKPLVPLGE